LCWTVGYGQRFSQFVGNLHVLHDTGMAYCMSNIVHMEYGGVIFVVSSSFLSLLGYSLTFDILRLYNDGLFVRVL